MAKEYISREAAIIGLAASSLMPHQIDDAAEALKLVPAADVAPARHASWIEDGYYNEPCVCSNCGEPCKDTVMGKPRWNYCPNCGAKMDGGQDDV